MKRILVKLICIAIGGCLLTSHAFAVVRTPAPTHVCISADTVIFVSGNEVKLVKDTYLPICIVKPDTCVFIGNDTVNMANVASLGVLKVEGCDSIFAKYRPIQGSITRYYTKSVRDSSTISVIDTMHLKWSAPLKTKEKITINIKDWSATWLQLSNVSFSLDSLVVGKDTILASVVLEKDSFKLACLVPVMVEETREVYLNDVKWWELLWVQICAGILLLIIIATPIVLIIIRKKKKDTPSDPGSQVKDSENEEESNEEESDEEEEKKVDEKKDGPKGADLTPEQLQAKIKELERQKKELTDRLDTAEGEKRRAIEAAVEAKRKELQKDIDRLQQDLEKKNKQLEEKEQKIKEEKENARTIEEKTKQKMQPRIDAAEAARDEAKDELRSTQGELRSTQAALDKTERELDTALTKISTLQEAQKQYADNIAFVPYAVEYAASIQKLFDIVASLETGVLNLSKIEMEDPYYLHKAISKYKLGVAEVDMPAFMTEVQMAATKQMTFADNGIARLANLPTNEQNQQVQLYFMLNYLTKYIGAVQIFNESIIGLPRLIDEISDKDVATFVQARQQLSAAYDKLQIKVICPKLFDSIGTNMDLRVEQVDAGFDSGEILEISNCLVYPVNGKKPADKIFVKAQK